MSEIRRRIAAATRRRRPSEEPVEVDELAGPDTLPRRRVPVTDENREARTAQVDAVWAQCTAMPAYTRDRLIPYENEVATLLELALELDDAPGHGHPIGPDGEYA